eukprot:XP_011445097.2 PREDICTED: uncharacterized protein LOC105340624 [Crassostrea gigas]
MSLLLVFFLSLGGCLAVDNPIFYGGSMSFLTFHDDRDNTVKVHLKLLTGWKIGTGPCGRSCPRSRTRTSTIQTRKKMLDDKGDGYFGNWEMEVSKSTGNTYKQNLTTIVKTNLTEKVESVNPRLEWELDTADLFVPIPDHVEYVDIIFEGNSWLELTVNKLTMGPPWHLQVKVNPHERSDTLGPNRSPIVQMKPFFKLGMNKTYAISLTAMDEDDDAIKCRHSQWVEAGPRLTSHRFRNANVDAESCTINIDTTDSSVFYENATGAIAVTVQDYARKLLKLKEEENLIHPYEKVLSAVTVQFFVFIVEHADEPIFVSPTHANQQTFIIYVGVEFTVDFYARPTAPDANRKIELFDVTRTGGRETNQTDIKFITDRTAKITVSWIPVGADLGKDILCARVEDNEGFESINLHCFTILIKPYAQHPQTPLQARPYFVFFPQPGDIVFPEHSFCKFPIYAASSTKGGITNISIQSTDAPSAVVVSVIRPVNSTYGPGAKMVEIQLKEPVGGVRKICFEASDADSSTVKCLFANVLKKDPCETNPCNNGGICFPSEDHNDFFCHCNKGFTGRTCNIVPPNVCLTMNPCLNSGTCVTKLGGSFFCLCDTSYTGIICENKVDKCLNDPCGDHGICIDGDTSSCNCTDGYTGEFCTSMPTSVNNNCNGTSNSLCQNEGICLIKSGQRMCICPVGLNGSSCESFVVENKLMFVPPTPEKDSVISCNVRLSPAKAPICEFPVYIQASSTPFVKSISSNTDLDVTTLQSEKFALQGVNNIYMTPVKLSQTYDTRSGSIYEFCLQASLTSEIASRCFSVDFEALPSPPRFLPKHPWDFIAPTPEKNTTFRCQLGKYCHVVVYTFFNDHCEQVLVTNSLGGKTFPTKEMNNKCVTDVVFTDVDSEGKHQVCLKSWKNGESRCYFVDVVKNIEGVCDPNPCENGGLCLHKDGMPFCICMTGYYGDNCTKGPCPSVNTQCKNGAFCFTNGKHETCFCQTGFSGPNCTHESAENITDVQHNGAKFTDAVYPTNITCYVSNPCQIPHIVTGSPSKNPLLRPGYLSPGIKIEEIKFDKHHNSTQVYQTTTIVKAETTGQKKVCLQIYNEQRLTSDEACFNITVVKGFEHKTQLFAHFIPPTPLNNTEMECEVGRPCHLSLWTSNKLGVNSCPFVKSNMKFDEGVYVFQEPKSVNTCMSDVSIQISNTGVTELCFSVLESSNSKEKTRETRCYQLKIVSSLSVKSACINVKCKNGGFCDSNTQLGECICVLGFSGRNCEIQRGVSLMTNVHSAILTDLAMPEKIMCHVKEKCDISFSISTNGSSRPDVKLGHYSGDITITTPVLYTEQLSLNSYLGHFTVTPNMIGTHVVCIQTSPDRKLTTDERCIDVVVENNKTKTTFNKNLPHFQTPTLPNNTEVACPASKTCHIVLSLSPGLNEGCPEIQQTKGNSDFTHVFNLNTNFKAIGNNCTADVAIKPSSNHNSSDPYCFDVSFPSVPGEKRCFNVTYKEPEKTLCVGFLCENGGFCETKDLKATCKCPITTSGKNCQSLGNQVTNTSSSVFESFAVPTFLICERLVTCIFPVTINGNLNVRDLNFGYVSNELAMEVRKFYQPAKLPTEMRIMEVEVMGRENGSYYACLQFQRSSKAMEHCMTIQIIDKDSNGTLGAIDRSKPHFEDLPLPNTEFHCNVNKDCHILLEHKAKTGNCSKVFAEELPGSVHIINSLVPDSNGICKTDVIVNSNAKKSNQTDQLCLAISDKNSDGERRCFKFFVNNETQGSSCEYISCLNSGYCEGDVQGNTSCVCMGGHTGPLCSLEGGSLPTNHIQYSSPDPEASPKFIDTAIPNILPCKVNTECGISLFLKGNPYKRPLVQTDSPIIKTPIESHKIPSTNGSYIVGVKFQSNETGIQNVCINTVKNRNKEDELCFKINVTDVGYQPPSRENNRNPAFKIREPSIPDGSSVKCEEDSACHLILHLNNYSTGGCLHAKVTPIIPDARVLSTYLLGNHCLADVVVRTHKEDLNKSVCVQIDGTTISSDREKRCVTITVSKHVLGSPCNANSCNGNGFCQRINEKEYKCMCKLGFIGHNCEYTAKPTPIPREKNNTNTSNLLPKFVDSVLPKEIKCTVSRDCIITIPVHGFPMNQSTLLFGHFDKGVVPGPIITENITDPTNQTLAYFHLKATNAENKYVCVQSSNLQINTDELCVKIVVANKTALMTTVNTPTMTPKIVDPSLPSGSVIQCEADHQSCHFHLVTQPTPSSNYCPDIKNMVSSTITKVHSFTSDHPIGPNNLCHVDVTFKPEVAGNHTLCIQAKDNGHDGDERCYAVNVVTKTNITYGGPCQSHPCYNKGHCEADPTAKTAICLCPVGLSDSNCQKIGPVKPTQSTTSPTSPSPVQKEFTDTAIPNVIQCPINSTCWIPLIISGPPGDIPKVNSNSPFIEQPIHTFTFPGSTNTTYQTVLKVHSTKEGLHQVCTHIGVKGDEICFQVNTTASSLNKTSGNNLKIITEPTIPDQSSVKCLENQVCHLLFHTLKAANGSCVVPHQSVVTSGTVVLSTEQTTFNQSLCVTDVATVARPVGQKTICLETSSTDKRCIDVNPVKNLTSSSPCNPNPCHGSGICQTTDYVTYSCVCITGWEGKTCETKVDPIPIPRRNTTTTSPSPTFVDTMLPKEMICYTSQDCTISFPISGHHLNQSSVLFGHLDKGVIPETITLENITSPLNQTIAQFHMTSISSGNKHVCFQTSDFTTNTDEICLKVVIRNASLTTTATPNQISPEIAAPSMPNGTVLQCVFGERSCHIPLYTKPVQGSSKCPEVQESAPSSLSSVFAFTSENPQGPLCHVDLSIKPNKPGNHTLCVKAKDQSNEGDTRCYKIQVVTPGNETFGGPCQQKHCYNNGKCEADPVSNSATCICPIGYPDENCLSNVSLSPPIPGSTVLPITKPIFTDTAIPDIIQCPSGSTCGVPLIIRGEPGKIPHVVTDSLLISRPMVTVHYPGKNFTYQTNIKVTGKMGLHTVCTHIADSGEKGDEICFKVNFTSPVSTLSSANPLKIEEPTIPDMSSVKCLENTTCHVLVHTTKGSNGKCLVPMLSPLSPGMAVLTTEETQFDPNLCVTDIATIVKPSETKKLCVDVTGSSYKRCIIVNSVRNMTKSSCNSNPCYGNGYCKSSDKNGFICICKLGFKGDHCENSANPVPIPRLTNDSTNESPKFVDTMLPKEITCRLKEDCSIAFPVNGSPINQSSILFGHVDKGINPGLTELKHQTNPVNQSIAHFHITPSSLGNRNVCFQTRNSKTNVDEVCLKVVVHNETQPAVSTPSPNSPEITHPSFPNGTVLQCEFSKEGCHISLYIKPAHGSNKCPEVINTVSSSISNIHAFHSQNIQGSTCHVDLSVKPEIPRNHTICIKVEDQGKSGDLRCYFIQVVTSSNKTFGGPCQEMHCQNEGKCEADPSSQSSTCICPIGFNDAKCESNVNVLPTAPGPTPQPSTKPIFTDTAIPDVIQCPAGAKCNIPLIIKGKSGKIPNVDSDNSLVSQPIETVHYPGKKNNTYQTNIQIIGSSGLHTVCSHIDDKGEKGDEICFKVNFTSPVTTLPTSNHFKIQEPTLPDTSSVKCLENTTCHVLVHTTKDNNGTCLTPRLNPRIPDTAVVTTEVTAFDSDLCVTDIATIAKHRETKKLCVDITGSTYGRCIVVNSVTNMTKSQCNNKPCQGNGYCKSTGDNSFVCLCKLGFKGILCATKTPPTPIPREKNDTTTVSPKFVNTMLPKEITCHLNEDCPIMLPVNGNPLNKSSLLFGHLDKGIEPGTIFLENVTTPVNQLIAHFHITPTESGTKLACIQTKDTKTNVDEVCMKLNIIPDQVPPTTVIAQVAPKIVSPSFLNGTVLQCENSPKGCHLHIVTKPTPGSYECPKIDSTGSSLQTIHFFKPDKVNNASVCHVDMSVKPDIPGNHSLCLTPREGV